MKMKPIKFQASNKTKCNKGQVFIILALIIVTVLVMIKVSLNLSNIMENKRYIEAGLDHMEFVNICNEFSKTVQIAYSEPSNISTQLNDFTRFTRQVMSSRAIDFKNILVETTYPTITAGSPIIVSITILNGLATQIQTMNVTFDSSQQIFTNIGDLSTIIANFTITPSSNANYTLSIFYITSYENSTEIITIPVEIGKSKFIGFFDIHTITDRGEFRDKFTETYTL
jgi:hypothetical protein